jgi:hypothetical protein
VSHDADDDGLWFLDLGDRAAEVQVESSTGNIQFLVEGAPASRRATCDTIDETVEIVVAWLGTRLP